LHERNLYRKEKRLCNSDVDLFGKSRNGNVCNGNKMEETMNFYLKIAIQGAKTSRSNLSLQPIEYLISPLFSLLNNLLSWDSHLNSNIKLLTIYPVKQHRLLHFIYIKHKLYFHVHYQISSFSDSLFNIYHHVSTSPLLPFIMSPCALELLRRAPYRLCDGVFAYDQRIIFILIFGSRII
jgi:hypothetical protein